MITDEELNYSPALVRMRDWQDKIATFWGKHPFLFYLMRLAPIWLTIAIASAYYEVTREYTAIFLMMALVTSVSREFIPLTPTPFNISNVVTSREDFYSTAARIVIVSFVVLMVMGIFVCLAEQAGNVSFHARTDYSGESIPSYWSKEMLPWLTVILIAIPFLYFVSLVVSNKFVAKYMPKMGRRVTMSI